jgi:hypothetical protein
VPDHLTLPNRIARYVCLAMEKVMGTDGINAVFSVASHTLSRDFSFAEMSTGVGNSAV